MNNYTFYNLLCEYNKNKKKIDCYISALKNGDTIEFYDKEESKIIGMSIPVFITLVLINLVIFILSIYYVIKNANKMPTWVLVLSVILIFVFPLLSLILACVVRK